jgi:DNA-directed RNA polymerase specialized sigma24 family protein
MAVTEGLDYMPLEGRLGSAAMEGSSNAGVTPEGVRAGDRAALQALVDRRGPAVVAFCMQVCGPQAADRAAAEAFARFRAAVRDAGDLTGLDPEALLRGATRHAAASMARQPSGPPPHGRLRSRGTQTCEHVPTMLAARANGALGDADLDRLARHLDRCERCDALAEIFRRAELAYQDPVVETLGTETTSVLMEALAAVSEHGVGTAPAPAGDAAAVEPLDGAFGHLPDLDDEIPLEVPAPVAVEPVEAPVEELDSAAYDDLDLGETIEWGALPEVADEHDPAGAVLTGGLAGAGVAAGPPAPLLEGGHTRRSGGPRPLLILLPVLLVAAIAAGVLALSGVFGGNDGTPAVEQRGAAGIEAPVTTPLPVTVKVTPPPAATAGTATSAVPSGTGAATGATAGTATGAAGVSSTAPGTTTTP